MNNKQEAQLRMFREVQLILNKYKTDVDTIAAMAREAANFNGYIVKIDAEHPRQAVDGKGVTISKNQMKKLLIAHITIFSGALSSYGKHQKNADLVQRMDVSKYDLDRASVADLIKFLNETVTEFKKFSTSMADYGITPEMVTSIEAEVASFKAASTMPRNVRVEKSTATSNLEEFFEGCNSTLKDHLDKFIPQFEDKNPAFYKDYNNARIVEDRGSRSKTTTAAKASEKSVTP